MIVRQTGYGGKTVTVDVEDEGQIVGSETVQLPADGIAGNRAHPRQGISAGARLFRFKVAPQDGEVVTQNNVRESISACATRPSGSSISEGEPRWEFKFLNRASPMTRTC